MYEELDKFLNEFADDNPITVNYWYDAAFEKAIQLIGEFSDEDWLDLLNNLDGKTDLWKERLAYCLVDKNNHYQYEILEKLLHTENDKLFIRVIDTLRTEFDANEIRNKKEVIDRINRILPTVDNLTKTLLLRFLDKDIHESDLKIFTDNVEEPALRQITELIEQDAFKKSKIRIMPDVHAEKNCVIGFTGDLGDKVIPNIVGKDIGCGMLCVNLGKVDIDYYKLDTFINSSIPNGQNAYENPIFNFNYSDLICFKFIKKLQFVERSLGTLGGGNHFIEVDENKDGDKYLIIHTGSRNLGAQVASFYQNLAISLNSESLTEYRKRRQELVTKYKSEGRENEINEALSELNIEYHNKKDSLEKKYCYLEGKYREAYLHDMKICQEYAKLNRYLIAKRIAEHMSWKLDDYFESVHNYIDMENNIVRKGAISAKKGERVIIPINMRDGCIIGVGKGNADWNYSAPHGAGRIMSRSKAKESINLEDFKTSMTGIYTSSVNIDTIDEAPFVYKTMDEIVSAIGPTVEITSIIKPVYNFKASEMRVLQKEESAKLI